ncbi:hypothetical protein LT20_04141 [Pseudomonas aeruginosa]|nr:hypothetical protein LT20_04141 [Pseudomonas aeruginosa]
MVGLRHFERTFELQVYGPGVTVCDLGEVLADQWQLASEGSLRDAQTGHYPRSERMELLSFGCSGQQLVKVVQQSFY